MSYILQLLCNGMLIIKEIKKLKTIFQPCNANILSELCEKGYRKLQISRIQIVFRMWVQNFSIFIDQNLDVTFTYIQNQYTFHGICKKFIAYMYPCWFQLYIVTFVDFERVFCQSPSLVTCKVTSPRAIITDFISQSSGTNYETDPRIYF